MSLVSKTTLDTKENDDETPSRLVAERGHEDETELRHECSDKKKRPFIVSGFTIFGGLVAGLSIFYFPNVGPYANYIIAVVFVIVGAAVGSFVTIFLGAVREKLTESQNLPNKIRSAYGSLILGIIGIISAQSQFDS